MKLIVDTNILFSFFWENSITKQILTSKNTELLSPEFALNELKKYSSLIIKKTKISKKEFNAEFNNLTSVVKFLPEKHYKNSIKLAQKFSPDENDMNFLALCLKLDLPLWSNDKELKKQDKVIVLDTKDIIEMF